MRNYLIALVLCLSLPAYALWGPFGSGAGDLSGGGTPAGGDYLNIPEYNSTIGLFELTSFTAGGVLTNRAYTATDTMTNGASANAITSIAETNGISALGSLDGTSDYANGSRFAGLENAQKATFSIWLKPNSTIVATDNIFNKYLNNDNYLSLQCSSASDFYFIGEGNTPTGYATTTNAGHVHNVWTHHTWVYDGTQADNASRLKYYWNGKEQGLNFTGTIQANLANNGEVLWLGKQRVNAWYYDGDMDGFTIWTNALTSEDATNLFWQTCWNNPTNTKDGVQINPAKGWTENMYNNRNDSLYQNATVWSSFNPLITGSGSVVADQSTNANHGTLQNFNNTWGTSHGLGYPTNGVIKTQAANAKVDYGDLADVDYGTNDFHIALWFNASDAIGSKRLVGKDNVTSQRQFAFNIIDDGSTYHLSFWYSTTGASGGIVSLDDSAVLQEDTWYHVVGQRVGNSFELYTNGVLSASGTSAGSHGSMAGTTANLLLGLTGTSINDFAGWMDDFIIGQGSLTTNQIQTLYGNGQGWN